MKSSFHSFLFGSKKIKRRIESEDDVDLYLSNRTNMTSTADVGTVDAVACSVNAAAEILSCRKTPAAKCKNIDRGDDKLWWSNGYRNWDDDEFRAIDLSYKTIYV